MLPCSLVAISQLPEETKWGQTRCLDPITKAHAHPDHSLHTADNSLWGLSVWSSRKYCLCSDGVPGRPSDRSVIHTFIPCEALPRTCFKRLWIYVSQKVRPETVRNWPNSHQRPHGSATHFVKAQRFWGLTHEYQKFSWCSGPDANV